jgi:phosphopantetheinyl transferase (holo-ACP synthase)
MIGNDVVDLRIAGSRPRSPRFDVRVMAPGEQEALRESGEPEHLRWVFWAAKEAAYKAARQLDGKVVFSPSRFVVDLRSEGAGEVEHQGRRFALSFDSDGERVHAVARKEGLPADAFAFRVRALEGVPRGEEQSREARRLAIELLSGWLDESPEALAIHREERVPRLHVSGAPSPVRISLSHHGRFVAAACGRCRRSDGSRAP